MVTYSPEMRERTPRMLGEVAPDHATECPAIRHVAQLLDMSSETLRLWRRRVEVEAAEEIKRMKREVSAPKPANEIVKSASVFFSKELDRTTTK